VRLVTAAAPGQVELAFMWLPTWLGMNAALKEELEKALAPELEGQPLTDEVLDAAHARVLDLLEARFPHILGLRAALDAVRHVRFAEDP
jgi:hypothetical protein